MDHDVTLTVPPTVAYVRILRLVAVAMAEESGLGYADVDDVRIAVDELANQLVASGMPGAPLHVSVRGEPGRLRIELRRAARGSRDARLSRLTERILHAAVDRFELDLTGREHRGSIEKVVYEGPPARGRW